MALQQPLICVQKVVVVDVLAENLQLVFVRQHVRGLQIDPIVESLETVAGMGLVKDLYGFFEHRLIKYEAVQTLIKNRATFNNADFLADAVGKGCFYRLGPPAPIL